MFLSNSVPTYLISFRLPICLHLCIAYTERRWTRSHRIWHAERRDRESQRRSTWQTVVSRLVTQTTGQQVGATMFGSTRGDGHGALITRPAGWQIRTTPRRSTPGMNATSSAPDPRSGGSARRRTVQRGRRRRWRCARHSAHRRLGRETPFRLVRGMVRARSVPGQRRNAGLTHKN